MFRMPLIIKLVIVFAALCWRESLASKMFWLIQISDGDTWLLLANWWFSLVTTLLSVDVLDVLGCFVGIIFNSTGWCHATFLSFFVQPLKYRFPQKMYAASQKPLHIYLHFYLTYELWLMLLLICSFQPLLWGSKATDAVLTVREPCCIRRSSTVPLTGSLVTLVVVLYVLLHEYVFSSYRATLRSGMTAFLQGCEGACWLNWPYEDVFNWRPVAWEGKVCCPGR